jgi:hypothetical protein
MSYYTSPTRPSQMFLDALSGGGSHYMTCGFCGREHYCPDAEIIDHDAEEYDCYIEDALERQNKYPGRVLIHYDVDCVMAKDVGDVAIVIDCPCNGLSFYEEKIWNSRHQIKKYINARIVQEAQWEEEQKVIDKLKGIK